MRSVLSYNSDDRSKWLGISVRAGLNVSSQQLEGDFMTTQISSARRTAPRRAAKSTDSEQRFRLSGVPWSSYVAIGDALRDWPIRMTYDHGELEFMTTSRKHERGGHIWGRLVCALTEELSIDMESGGGMTFQREDLERGFEPDECYWIEHELQMRHKDSYDSKTDPPPDLALEIEVSRSALDRMAIYAAFRVPEVWRWDGKTIHVHVLDAAGQYAESTKSRAFPFLPVNELARFVNMRNQLGTTALVRAFREWVRDQQAKGWPKHEKNHGKSKRTRRK